MIATELSGQRIGALCEMEGISRKAIADRLGVSAAKLSKIENGQQRFPEGLAHSLARAYSVPEEFFAPRDAVVESVVPTFRKNARARVNDDKRVVRLAREAAAVFLDASDSAGYRAFEFSQDPELLADVEQCALEFRRAGGIEDGAPVGNVTRLLERQGIGVIRALTHDSDRDDHAGVSLPTRHNDRPLAALPTRKPGAIARFTLAHEAAHHIWDKDLPAPLTSTRDPRELRAHQFAGAVLIPESAIRKHVTETTTLRAFLPLKAELGVSVGALIKRAQHLGAISGARTRSLMIQLSSLGWRDPLVEPVEVTEERPLLLGQCLARVTDMNALSLARHTGLRPELVRFWVEPDEPRDIARDEAEVVDLTAVRAQRSRTRQSI